MSRKLQLQSLIKQIRGCLICTLGLGNFQNQQDKFKFQIPQFSKPSKLWQLRQVLQKIHSYLVLLLLPVSSSWPSRFNQLCREAKRKPHFISFWISKRNKMKKKLQEWENMYFLGKVWIAFRAFKNYTLLVRFVENYSNKHWKFMKRFLSQVYLIAYQLIEKKCLEGHWI